MIVELLTLLFWFSFAVLLEIFGMLVSYISGVSYAITREEESRKDRNSWVKTAVLGVLITTGAMVVSLQTNVDVTVSEYAIYWRTLLVFGLLSSVFVNLLGRVLGPRSMEKNPDLEREVGS